MRALLVLAGLLLAAPAFALEVTYEWTWPTAYCNGDPLFEADIDEVELIVATSTIPRQPSACTPAPDVPPSGGVVISQTVTPPNLSATVDLQCGQTYYAVIRVRVGDEWSNFSGERVDTIPCGQPGIPLIIRVT